MGARWITFRRACLRCAIVIAAHRFNATILNSDRAWQGPPWANATRAGTQRRTAAYRPALPLAAERNAAFLEQQRGGLRYDQQTCPYAFRYPRGSSQRHASFCP